MLFNFLMAINCYLIFYLIYSESFQPLIDRLEEKKRKKYFLYHCFIIGTTAMLFAAMALFLFIEIICVDKIILQALPYAALVGGVIPYIMYISKLFLGDYYLRNEKVFIHGIFIAIFICISVYIGKLSITDLIDTFSYFMFMTLMISLGIRKSIWSILYIIVGIISLVFSVASLSTFMGLVDGIKFFSSFSPYVVLVASLVSYLIILMELYNSVKKQEKRPSNIWILRTFILGTFFSLGVYYSGLNVSYVENGFSFIAFAISTYMFYEFN